RRLRARIPRLARPDRGTGSGARSVVGTSRAHGPGHLGGARPWRHGSLDHGQSCRAGCAVRPARARVSAGRPRPGAGTAAAMKRSIFGVYQLDEVVGAVVLVCIGVFVAVLINAGLLKDWFQPSFTLRILLPDEGVSGLAPGAEVQVLGTRAGEVRRIVIDPNQRMHAVARVEDQMRPFIRRDSVVSIRRQFGVAGAALLDISRGTGPELDWSYAVIAATSERAPTDTLGQMIDELRAKVIPILDDVHKAVEAFTAAAHRLVDPAGPLEQTLSSAAAVVRKIESGDGVAGRLISNDKLGNDLEASLVSIREM